MIIDVRLLGDRAVHVVGTGRRLTFATQKALATFAYLALRQHLVPRQELACLLWADVPGDQARHSLRQALFEIRGVLGPDCQDVLHAGRDVVALDHHRVRTDVHRFERLAARGTPPALGRARALYGGDLLVGLHVRERPFDAWLAAERYRLKQLAAEAGLQCAVWRVEPEVRGDGARTGSPSRDGRLISVDTTLPLHAHQRLQPRDPA